MLHACIKLEDQGQSYLFGSVPKTDVKNHFLLFTWAARFNGGFKIMYKNHNFPHAFPQTTASCDQEHEGKNQLFSIENEQPSDYCSARDSEGDEKSLSKQLKLTFLECSR